MKDCLEDHRDDPGFSAECKEEFELMMEARAADFRLDSTLREMCDQDIEDVCGLEKVDLESAFSYLVLELRIILGGLLYERYFRTASN